jgi:hypothetical protein
VGEDRKYGLERQGPRMVCIGTLLCGEEGVGALGNSGCDNLWLSL